MSLICSVYNYIFFDFTKHRKIDQTIITILRQRFEDCMLYEGHEREKCRALIFPLEEAETNYFTKCKLTLHIIICLKTVNFLSGKVTQICTSQCLNFT